MSNVIKAYSIRYEEENIKTIDNHLKRENDIQEKRNNRIIPEIEQEGFVEGLQAAIVDPLPTEEGLSEQSVAIHERAEKEAKAILEKARLEAEQITLSAHDAARKKGYEEGKQQSLKDIQKQAIQLEQLKAKQREEYEALISELEPKTAEIIAELVGRITGILVEDQKEVILYLVEKAFLGLDKADEYTIRVSREDFELVNDKKDYLCGLLGKNASLNIIEDSGLTNSQCMIETELKVIDCSLDVQLTNLITNIKLLGSL